MSADLDITIQADTWRRVRTALRQIPDTLDEPRQGDIRRGAKERRP